MQRTLDTTALAGICGVLLIAFFYQFMLGELPCPLCALQRVGFIVAGAALVLNLRAGMRFLVDTPSLRSLPSLRPHLHH